ncbi:MAG: 23S rRNA (adenine(2503)-C(2))-methyltransferase RlmN [Kiritimatiellia bacterium]
MRPAWSIHPDEWKPLLEARGLRAFRADQIVHSLYRDYIADWDAATTLPRDLRDVLKAEFPIVVPRVLAKDGSGDGTTKLLLELADGNSIETVVIPARGRLTQCISSQVGCAMGCAFCASGSRGLVRSLTADEIVAEVMVAQRLFATPDNRRQGSGLCLTNVVVMGMGEPFANYDETMRALKILNAGKGPNLGARHITLSTCGVVPGFRKLAAEGLQFELSVSLHAPNDEIRTRLMPVNRRWPIEDLLAACRDYTRATGRVITFEYTLVKGLNDSRACAEELVRRLRRLPSCKVNLIPLSPVDHRPDFETPDEPTLMAFLDVLMKARIQTMLRRSRGRDVAAACGQLRLRNLPQASHDLSTRRQPAAAGGANVRGPARDVTHSPSTT